LKSNVGLPEGNSKRLAVIITPAETEVQEDVCVTELKDPKVEMLNFITSFSQS
jgi:hypothetical protein